MEDYKNALSQYRTSTHAYLSKKEHQTDKATARIRRTKAATPEREPDSKYNCIEETAVRARDTAQNAFDLVALLVSGGHANGFDHRVTLVVHAGLDALRKRYFHVRLLALERIVDGWVLLEHFGHDAVMLGEVRHHVRADISREAGVVLIAIYLSI